MYTVSVFLAILAFILAFIPKYGVILTLLFGVTSIVIVLLGKGENKHQKKEVIAINSVLLIFGIIIATSVNLFFVSQDEETDTDYTYYDYVENATTYNVGEKIILDEGEIVINNISNVDNEFLVELSITLNDESSISSYDFCIIDADNSSVYYPEYSENVNLGSGVNDTLKFKINSDYSKNGLFLYYNVKESCFKIKI